ncbi:hypothetical protein JCM1840_007361 [Sporobolomyces johnsonii]
MVAYPTIGVTTPGCTVSKYPTIGVTTPGCTVSKYPTIGYPAATPRLLVVPFLFLRSGLPNPAYSPGI